MNFLGSAIEESNEQIKYKKTDFVEVPFINHYYLFFMWITFLLCLRSIRVNSSKKMNKCKSSHF